MLGQLSRYGAIGVGLIAGEPRQILSVRPLFTPSQFAGQKIRIVDNPQTGALVTALGAHPVQGLASTAVNSPLQKGSLAGVATSPFYVAENAYQNLAPYLTSYAIFGKFETLTASKRAWGELSPAEQAAMKQAVADTRGHSGQLASRESLELTQLPGCCGPAAAAAAPPGTRPESWPWFRPAGGWPSPFRPPGSAVTAAAPLPAALPLYGAAVAVLGYRAMLTHLLLQSLNHWRVPGRRPAGWWPRLVIGACYAAVLLPVPADGFVTAALMAGLAVLAGLAVRRAAADRRPVVLVVALAAGTLAAAWWLAAAGVADGDGLAVANDVALIVAAVAVVAVAVVAGSLPQRWLAGAIHGLVVDLGPSRHPELPVAELLAGTLADPELEVRYGIPGRAG